MPSGELMKLVFTHSLLFNEVSVYSLFAFMFSRVKTWIVIITQWWLK